MDDKKSFVFFFSWRDALSGCTDEVRLEVYDAIIEYAQSGTLPELKPLSQMAFQFIKLEIDRNSARYEQIKQARREAGRRGAQITNNKHRQKLSSSANTEFDETQVGKTGIDVDVDVDVDESLSLRDNAPQAQDQTEREKFLRILLFEKCLIRPAQELERFISHYSKTGWKDKNGNKIIHKYAALRAWDCRDAAQFSEPQQLDLWENIVLLFFNVAKFLSEKRVLFLTDFRGVIKNGRNITILCTKKLTTLIEENISPDIIEGLHLLSIDKIFYRNCE